MEATQISPQYMAQFIKTLCETASDMPDDGEYTPEQEEDIAQMLADLASTFNVAVEDIEWLYAGCDWDITGVQINGMKMIVREA